MISTDKKPTLKSVRVVVDEVLGSRVRLLKAARLKGVAPDDFGIDAWSDEEELVLLTSKVEGFVGFMGGRKLAEGDIFFIKDGSQLNNDYKFIERKKARELHLLCSVEDAKDLARSEISIEYAKLSVANFTDDAEEKKKLHERVQENEATKWADDSTEGGK